MSSFFTSLCLGLDMDTSEYRWSSRRSWKGSCSSLWQEDEEQDGEKNHRYVTTPFCRRCEASQWC